MSNQAFVLKALRILSFQDLQKITEIAQATKLPLKKAAGEELVFWEEPPIEETAQDKLEAKVIPFTKSQFLLDQEALMATPEKQEKVSETEKDSKFLNSDSLLWQRELAKQAGGNLHKVEALKGYKKSNEMYVVKTHNDSGKEKLKFASTGGVLVNKKQA